MKSIWIASYENNEVKVENTWFNGERLYVNGILQDERFGFFSSNLTGHIMNSRNEKEAIKVNLGGCWRIDCRLFINDNKVEIKQMK
jgi:hypothetical protein